MILIFLFPHPDQIFFVLSSGPDTNDDIQYEDYSHCAEDWHGLQEVLQTEHCAEVDSVGWNSEVTTETMSSGYTDTESGTS